MKQIFVIAALLLSFASKAQVVINITSDTTFATTFQCSTNTIINGNGKKVVDAKTGAQLQFNHYGCRYYRKNMSNDHFVSCEIPFETWFENSEIEVTLFYHKAATDVELVVRDLKINN